MKEEQTLHTTTFLPEHGTTTRIGAAGRPNHNGVWSPILPVESGHLLLTAPQAAAMVGKSTRTWRAWDAAGKIPQPIRIGRSTLWRVDELRAWVGAGCPRRKEWNLMQS